MKRALVALVAAIGVLLIGPRSARTAAETGVVGRRLLPAALPGGTAGHAIRACDSALPGEAAAAERTNASPKVLKSIASSVEAQSHRHREEAKTQPNALE